MPEVQSDAESDHLWQDAAVRRLPLRPAIATATAIALAFVTLSSERSGRGEEARPTVAVFRSTCRQRSSPTPRS
jgi:hypothetical protein